MHRHDLNLIAEYASGLLDDDSKARSLVESCDVCRGEYELQKAVVDDLSHLGQAAMTDLERAAIHRDVWTELRAGTGAERARIAPWYRWSFAAAGLFVVVGLIAVLNNAAGDDSGDALQTVGGELATQDAGDGGSEEAFEAPTETTSAGADAGADPGAEADGVAEDPVPFAYSALIDEARRLAAPPPAAFFANPSLEERAEQCLISAGLEGYRAIGNVDETSLFLLAIPAGVEFEEGAAITVVDFETCVTVHIDP